MESSSSSDSESETSLRPEDIESDAGQVIEANHHQQHHQTNIREEERLSQGNQIFYTSWSTAVISHGLVVYSKSCVIIVMHDVSRSDKVRV